MRLSIDGATVFAATGGRPVQRAGPAVVFIHGAGCDRTGWMLPARHFAHHGWSVLAPDLPGHGLSDGPALTSIEAMSRWLERLLDAAGIAQAALVGHSMGGAIAIETAARLPERVTHLGLVGTAAAIPVGPALLEAARTAPGKAYDMMTAWALSPAARRGGNPAPGLWMAGGVKRTFESHAPDVLATDLAACASWTTGEAAAQRITCPTEVIVASLDVMTPPKRGEALARLVPGAKFTMLDGVGHMIPQEAPDALLDALTRRLVAV